MLNSEKIEPVTLAVIMLHLSEVVTQIGSQLVENSAEFLFFIL